MCWWKLRELVCWAITVVGNQFVISTAFEIAEREDTERINIFESIEKLDVCSDVILGRKCDDRFSNRRCANREMQIDMK